MTTVYVRSEDPTACFCGVPIATGRVYEKSSVAKAQATVMNKENAEYVYGIVAVEDGWRLTRAEKSCFSCWRRENAKREIVIFDNAVVEYAKQIATARRADRVNLEWWIDNCLNDIVRLYPWATAEVVK